MKNTAILGLALLLALSVGATVSLAAVKPQNDNLVKVFVHFKETPGRSERGLVRALGGTVTHSYTIIPAVAAEVPESAIQGLLHNPHVVAVEEDHKVEAVGITHDTEYSNAWGVGRIESGYAHDGGSKGAGVKIGIIDSGINYTHPDLAPNYKGGYDFYYYDLDPMDVYGHGTHVAGTACAADNDNGVKDGSGNPLYGVVGVAPECDLYSLRVLGDSGSGYESDIVYAIQWALGDAIDIYWNGEYQDSVVGTRMDVVNLSLGSSQAYSTASELTFARAEEEGLIIVAAAGNSGNPGGKGTNTIYPANYDSVIAVAATDSSDNRASFSSTGEKVELAAPGVSVYSAWNDNTDPNGSATTCRNGNANDCYKYGSGTSMASPHVAGAAALIIAAGYSDYNGDGFINNRDVRAILQDSAIDLGVAGRDTKYGFGLVNVRSAVQLATGEIHYPPIANAGADQVVVDADANGSESIALDGTGSSDPDGFIASYEWYEGAALIASGVSPTVALPLGSHTITLIVADNEGATASDSVLINVVSESSGITLSTVGYKVKGVMKADLTWSGATPGNVDVYRNGTIIVTTANDGAHTDNTNQKGSGTFIYKICEAGTSVCSNESSVTF
ncbi:MAG TPA: S8 family serine peptidase [Candidatus Paceibacterota bacterium]